MIVDGLHVPFIPLFDVPGSVGAVLFWHKGPICVNVGVNWTVITISIVTGTAQPAEGVKVYVVVPAVDVLIVEGLHVPLIPLVDDVANDGAVLF